MKRTSLFLGCLALLLSFSALTPRAAKAQPTIANPRVNAININGRVSGTVNSTFVFRAEVTPSANAFLLGVWVYIDPTNPGAPEQGTARLIVPMQPDQLGPPSAPNGFEACIVGSDIAPEVAAGQLPSNTHNWSIVAQDTSTGGTPPGFASGPKPGTVDVYTTQIFQIMPVDANFLPDKRLIPGQPGNGLRINPVDPTSTDDGGGASIYTWRVRVKTVAFPGGLPQGGFSPQYFLDRTAQEWRDTRGRFDSTIPQVQRYNSGVMLVLISPDGTKHFCPMEIDPDAPGQAGLQQQFYPVDPILNQQYLQPTGSSLFQWNNSGVFFRYRMVPTQYIFNHGPLIGEGPFTAFGGPTLPDSTPAIPIGWGAGADGDFSPANEIIGRPYQIQYTSFAGPDRNPFAPAFPFYTDILNRAGQWKYYFMCTADLRPPTRGGFNPNFVCVPGFGFPTDIIGNDPNAYFFNFDADTGQAPPDPSQPYLHPMVTPILSDGGWTDDLPENGWGPPYGVSGPAHRSRVTTTTRIRFMVRATQPDNNRPPLLVRVFVDGTSPANSHPMQILPIAGNNDYTKGVVYFFDMTFTEGQQGPHWMFFEADDGVHKAIWPRRDTAVNGSGDARFFDLQANVLSAAKPDSTDFGTGTVGKNFLDEPFVNSRSVLTNPVLTPPSGSEGQAFTYEVNFFDADGDEPLDSIVNIDGIDHRMAAVTNVPTNTAGGRKYRFVLNALAATTDSLHHYYFKFRDNWNNPATLGKYNISPQRREFGQWVTLPAGDESGNPSSTITGPTIISNHAPEQSDATFTFSDPAQTPATLFDFVMKYKDADNNPPTTITVYLSNDNGATFPFQYSLVKAENNSNYTAGVQYHLPTRVHLAESQKDLANKYIPYIFKFVSNDAIIDQTLIRVGSGQSNIGAAHTLATTDNVNYFDPQGANFKNWSINPNDTVVWRIRGNQTVLLDGPGSGSPDYVLADPVNGFITFTGTGGSGPVLPGDVFKVSYYYLYNVGPVVKKNTPPTLTTPIPNPPGDQNTNDGTLTPKSGSSTSSFKYSIVYTDADNQPPAYVNLVVDTNTTIAMTMDPATPTPVDYTRGVKYNVTVTGATLGNGTHSYHFETSDGADIARYPAPPDDLSGPSVADIGDLHLPPFANFTDKAIVPFPKGKSNDNYLFTVVYQNTKGLAPQFPVELRVKDNVTNNITNLVMNPIDPVGPAEYQNGVRYQLQLTAPNAPLAIGKHDITFGFQGQGAATTPLTLTVNGPPVLSNQFTPADNSSISQASDVTFSITYTDPNNDAPSFIRAIVDQGTQGQKTINLTPAPGQPQPLNYTTGVVFQGIVPGGVGPNSLPIGPHKFHFVSNDGTEDSNTVPTPADATVNIIAAQPPVLSEPTPGDAATNNGTLTPLAGARSASYTYSVKYTHPQGVAPATIQVVIDGGAPVALQPPAGPLDYTAGVVFTFVSPANFLAAGSHNYFFQAADRINSTRLPAGNATYTGPTINFPPALSNGTVQVQGGATSTINGQNALNPAISGNVLTKLIFSVTYTDQDNVAPGAGGYVRVVVDAGPNQTVIPLSATGPLNYGSGVTFTSAATGLTAGTHTFHFEASDGLDPVKLPAAAEVSGISIANLPVLEAPNTGTLSPTTGPLSTTFTYQIKYRHPDNVAPQSVKVFIDGQAFNMSKVNSSTNYAAGELYQFTNRFQSGSNHTYRFEAVDTVSTSYTAYFPGPGAGNTINGPTINVPVFSQPTFNPNPGVAGQQLTINGQLVTTPNVPQNQPISIKLIRPDGTGFNQNAQSNVDGTFQTTFTPDQTGDWKVEFSWAGTTGFDPVSSQFPFKVTGFAMSLNAGELDMIGPVLVPVTPDPSITFGVTDNGGGNLPVTELNLIKWVPSAGTGRYFVLNQDASFPGITGGNSYWVRPNQSLKINPRGKLWAQDQPFSIPLTNGWNMISSVYLSDISWSSTQVRFQGTLMPIAQAGNVVRSSAWTYDKNTGGYTLVDLGSGVLKTGRGYWVRALQDCELVLQGPGVARSATITRDAVDRSTSIQIMARNGNRADQDNFVDLTGTTASRLALMEKPPYIGDYVSVKLLDPAKVQIPADSRAATTGKTVIPFQVETDRKNADITVQFPNFAAIGRKYEVSLMDLSTKTTRAIGTSGAYTFNSGDAATARQFALVVSTRGHNGLALTNVQASNSPSGRGAGVSLSYTISANANVRAQIVGGAGTTVRELGQGRAATAGTNTLLWDGKNNQGIAVPAGTYMLKLTASDDSGHQVTATTPITLVR